MTIRPVYVVATGSSLPGEPIGDDGAEAILGAHSKMGSKARALVQKNNGIRTRHYALDPVTREPTHTNASLTVDAVRALRWIGRASEGPCEKTLDGVDLLCCGTSSPDQLIPAHGAMVHGALGIPPCEVATSAGVCLSSLNAFKAAWLGIAAGLHERAVVTGSELVSIHLRKERYLAESETRVETLQRESSLAFEKEFLRWMLSDGAGACLLEGRPAAEGLSLRVEWLEMVSYANEFPTCMYMGAERDGETGALKGWGTHPSVVVAVERGALHCGQDAKLLAKNIGAVSVQASFTRALAKHPMEAHEVDWFLPHYSSEFFRQELHDRLVEAGFPIRFERWFTNLQSRGNTGSASIFVMLDELCRSGRLAKGQTVLCFVPESARFSVGWMRLTVVDADEG